jgi:hypothetical protein
LCEDDRIVSLRVFLGPQISWSVNVKITKLFPIRVFLRPSVGVKITELFPFIFSVLKKGLLRTIGCGKNDRNSFLVLKNGLSRTTDHITSEEVRDEPL